MRLVSEGGIRVCSECGTIIPGENAFCGKCGVAAPPAEAFSPATPAANPNSGTAQKLIIAAAGIVCIFGFVALVSSSSSNVPNQTSASTVGVSTTANRSSAPPDADTSSRWYTNESVNSIDGVKTTVLRNESGEGTIIIRFKGNALDAYVITPQMVGYEDSTVRIRFDDGQATRQSWSRSSDYHAIFASDPRGLIAKLQTSKKFYLEYHPYQKVAETITFDVSGLAVPQPLLAAYDKRHKLEHAAWQKKFDACMDEQRNSTLKDNESEDDRHEYCKAVTY